MSRSESCKACLLRYEDEIAKLEFKIKKLEKIILMYENRIGGSLR